MSTPASPLPLTVNIVWRESPFDVVLLEENLSRRIVPFLQTDFPGSTQVALVGMERASDEEIWRYAKNKGYCIVTRNADFYDLGLVKGAPPKVIWSKSGSEESEIWWWPG